MAGALGAVSGLGRELLRSFFGVDALFLGDARGVLGLFFGRFGGVLGFLFGGFGGLVGFVFGLLGFLLRGLFRFLRFLFGGFGGFGGGALGALALGVGALVRLALFLRAGFCGLRFEVGGDGGDVGGVDVDEGRGFEFVLYELRGWWSAAGGKGWLAGRFMGWRGWRWC